MHDLRLIPGTKGPFIRPPKHCWLRFRLHNWTVVKETARITGPQRVNGIATICQVMVCWTCREVSYREFKAIVSDPQELKREYV